MDSIATIRAHFKRRDTFSQYARIIDEIKGRERRTRESESQRGTTLDDVSGARMVSRENPINLHAHDKSVSERHVGPLEAMRFYLCVFHSAQRIIPRMKIHSPRELILSRPARPTHPFTFFFPFPSILPCHLSATCEHGQTRSTVNQHAALHTSTFLDCDSAVICGQYPNNESATTRPPSFSINFQLVSRIASCAGNSSR